MVTHRNQSWYTSCLHQEKVTKVKPGPNRFFSTRIYMQRKYSRLIELLKGEMNGRLRAVGRYDKDEYEVLFARDDVESEYSTKDMEKIHHEMVLKGLGNQRVESLFNNDKLDCSIYQFRDTVRLHFVHQDYRGYYVSFDYNEDINPTEIVTKCKEIMD